MDGEARGVIGWACSGPSVRVQLVASDQPMRCTGLRKRVGANQEATRSDAARRTVFSAASAFAAEKTVRWDVAERPSGCPRFRGDDACVALLDPRLRGDDRHQCLQALQTRSTL